MLSNSKITTQWKRSFYIMWTAQFIGMSAITGVVAFLPLYIMQLGVTNTSSLGLWAGILMGATSFFAALSNPYWGAMADRQGRKPMVEKVLFLFGLIMMVMAFVTNVYQLLALRIFQGLCGGFVAAATALGLSMAPKEKIPFIVGMFQTALIVGGAVGPMIGGVIADLFGYRLPFIIFGALCLVTLIIIRFAISEAFIPTPKSEQPSIKETLRYIWSLGDLKVMLIVLFLAQFAMQSIGPILPIYIQNMVSNTGSLASISGTIIAIGGITRALASASMGLINRHFSHRRILTIASILCAVTFIGQLAANSILSLGIMRAINGLCIGAMIPSANTIVTYLIPEAKRGAAYGITGGAALMGNVLGPLCAGLFSIFFGISSIFWVTSLLFLFVFVILFVQIKADYHPQMS